MDAETRELLSDLADLHKQATEERSHYYVGNVVKRCIVLITRLALSLDKRGEG